MVAVNKPLTPNGPKEVMLWSPGLALSEELVRAGSAPSRFSASVMKYRPFVVDSVVDTPLATSAASAKAAPLAKIAPLAMNLKYRGSYTHTFLRFSSMR